MASERQGETARRARPGLGAGGRDAVSRVTGRPWDLALATVAVAAGAVVLFVAHDLFPYHSINHDEGVYLQQAAMLLDGNLVLRPPVPEAVRPWFFVLEDGRMYPKYSPVAALLFTPWLALGVPRLGLAVMAALIVAAVGLLAREAFDDRVAVLAAALVATAPMFVLTSAVFLSYAPTTMLNLWFALAYVRTVRRESLRYAALAGTLVGFAFFSRPYTAVLFALPFLAHALVTLGRVWVGRGRDTRGSSEASALTAGQPWAVTRRLGLVAALGTCFVGVTLAYNWVVTGDSFLFPYQAFAPEDGIGFGHREILHHERDYTVPVAIEANRRVLRQLVTNWGPLGWLGSALAVVGLVAIVAGGLRRRLATRLDRLADESADAADPAGSPPEASPGRREFDPLPDGTLRALLAALFVTISVGNIAFWGNLNVLAAVEDPTDGLIAYLGPFYHFDLLAPLSVFAAAGVVALGDGLRSLLSRVGGPFDRRVARNAVLAVAVVAALVGGASVGASAFEEPVERNVDYREDRVAVYEPFERTDFEHALVFVPTDYGPWLNHPFQWLRNDPSFDGDVVYVQNRGPEGDAASLDAFHDRTPYRFGYRGGWPPDGEVTPFLEPLSVREGDRLRVRATVGVVAGAQAASVRVEADGKTLHYGVDRVDGETETVEWTLESGAIRLDDAGLRRYGDARSLSLDGPTRVTLTVTFVQPGGSTITYVQETTVVGTDGEMRALWPPKERVCRLTSDCEETYVPGGDYATGVSFTSNATAKDEA
jgi:hypothetical protein